MSSITARGPCPQQGDSIKLTTGAPSADVIQTKDRGGVKGVTPGLKIVKVPDTLRLKA